MNIHVDCVISYIPQKLVEHDDSSVVHGSSQTLSTGSKYIPVYIVALHPWHWERTIEGIALIGAWGI